MKNQVRKLAFNPKILDETIVKDSLEAVTLLEKKEPLYLIGGVAVQSYLPTSCRRPTSDIDYAIIRPLSYHDFKEMINPVAEFLKDNRYSTETKKGSRAFMLIVYDDKKSEGLAIEFAKKNEANFQKRKIMLERELENTRIKIIEERDKTYRVACPEDLAIPKLVRSINSLDRNKNLEVLLPEKLKSFSNQDLERILNKIDELRQEAMISPGDLCLAEKLRFVSDLYDVRILAEITGFNEDYLNKIEREWLSIDSKPNLRDRIFDVTFLTK